MKVLICVVVYNRIHTIQNWLAAWKQCEKYSAQLAVFHNHDGESPPAEQREIILAGNPDFYISRPNIGADLGVFQDVIKGKFLNDYNWDALGWFVDDYIPMCKDFLAPMLQRIQPITVGMVGACYEPANECNRYGHFRTVGFMGKQEVFQKLQFPADPMIERSHAFEMEHGCNNMTAQIEKMGYEVLPVIGNKFPEPGYSHWPNNSHWMWDCSLLSHMNLWPIFNKEFGTCYAP